MSEEAYRNYLAHEIRRRAERDLPIPIDLFMASETAGLDPEEIYGCHQDDGYQDDDHQDVWNIVDDDNLDETNEKLWNRIIGEGEI